MKTTQKKYSTSVQPVATINRRSLPVMKKENREIYMRKPIDSLDDYVVGPVPETEPPLPVLLRRTGEIEVLRPLAVWEHPVKLIPAASPYRFSWFHRSLAIGGGLAMIALVLLSAIFIGISDQRTSEVGDIAYIEVNDENAVTDDQLTSSDIFSIPDQEQATSQPAARSRRTTFAARVRPRTQPTAARPQLQIAEPEVTIAKFSPTTMIIYIENGVIKSRIEPWLTKPVSFSN